jgi:alkylhydroperoxidase family enzyme
MARLGDTPDAVRARVPAALASWEFMRDRVLQGGLLEPELKELCFRFLAQDDAVMDFDRFSPRERVALRWAQAIAWDADLATDELWGALHAEFSDPELVELGCSIGFALGQQHWERTLGFAAHAGLR